MHHLHYQLALGHGNDLLREAAERRLAREGAASRRLARPHVRVGRSAATLRLKEALSASAKHDLGGQTL